MKNILSSSFYFSNYVLKVACSNQNTQRLISLSSGKQPEKSENEKKPRTRRTKAESEKRAGVTISMKDFLNAKPCLTVVSRFIPERFLRMKNCPSYYNFVVDDEVAANFVSLIKSELEGDIPVVEANPGLGLLTRYLLKSGLPRITVFDPAFHPLPPLKQLMNDNPERISTIPSNFFEVYKYIAQDKMDNGDRFYTMFKNFNFKEWTEEPPFKVVGCLSSPFYINCIMKSIAFHDGFVKLGRVQHFVAIADDIYKHIAGDRGRARLRTHTLFNIFFDLELKGEFPRVSFLPWDKAKQSVEIRKRVMYLVKITPKSNIYDQFSDDKLKVLWYLVQDLCRTKRNKVIAYFEKWVPWSGLKLIKEGLSPETEIGDLTVAEFLQLFYIFTSLPEFNEANFIHIQESGALTDTFENIVTPKDKKISKIGFS